MALLVALLVAAPILGASSSAGDLPSVVPADRQGFSSERLGRIVPAMQRFIDAGQIPGTVTLVARHGEVVHFEAAGNRHVAKSLPMTKDTIFRLYSQTKPVTGAAVMILFEEGRFLLDQPVADFLPELAEMKVYAGEHDGEIQTEPAARPITIRHLLTHTAGLTYSFFQNPVAKGYQKAGLNGALTDAPKYQSLAEWTSALAEQPLLAQPGEAWNYSVAIDVLGRLIEVVSGKTFGEFLEERIFRPLGMVDTAFFVPAEKLDRFAALYAPTPAGKMILFDEPTASAYRSPPKLEMGGSGLVGTAADYLRFAQMLANGGELDGVRILAPATVKLMMSNHLPESMGDAPLSSLFEAQQGVRPRGLGFGLAGSVITDAAAAGLPGPAGIYSWGGAATTHFWVDPENQLVGIVMTQLIPDGTYPLRQLMQVLTYQAMME